MVAHTKLMSLNEFSSVVKIFLKWREGFFCWNSTHYINMHTAALYGLRTLITVFLLFLTCMYYISICCICLYCRYLDLIFMIESCNVLWDDVDVWASQPELHWQKTVCLWFVWLWADTENWWTKSINFTVWILDIILSEGLICIVGLVCFNFIVNI